MQKTQELSSSSGNWHMWMLNASSNVIRIINLRILFDIDPSGQYLGAGGQDGLVHLYDLQKGQWASASQAALGYENRASVWR
ncbi:hypothetical protein L6164_003401 [Bauhinia variegata]|uniref:Uncharacterized protein n=1 Tax=Bauhinia variegata TaxID=167791 RepID=A0ACB9Q2P5_BAUVA|nr:hypothetical protein L6164_003401 [Bauhinia variegata]